MDNQEEIKIVISRDGPYEVHGAVPLTNAVIGANEEGESLSWEKGREYDVAGERYDLCRCGHSRCKPMCDGTHEDVEFNGREHADRKTYAETARLQAGEAVDLLDDSSLCAGARFCDVGEGVWRYAQKSADPDNRAMAIDEACKCPSGRLTIVDQEGRMLEPELEKEISPVQDLANDFRGPLWVKGGIPIEGANGEKYETRNRVTLCRCGQSKNQPYCDASHYDCEHMAGTDE